MKRPKSRPRRKKVLNFQLKRSATKYCVPWKDVAKVRQLYMNDKKTNSAIKYKTTWETISNAINSSTSWCAYCLYSITRVQVDSEKQLKLIRINIRNIQGYTYGHRHAQFHKFVVHFNCSLAKPLNTIGHLFRIRSLEALSSVIWNSRNTPERKEKGRKALQKSNFLMLPNCNCNTKGGAKLLVSS